LKDTEFAKEMEAIIESSALQPARLNYKLGLELFDCSRQERFVEMTFKAKEWCKNPSGGIHGGVISSLFDTVTGMGAVGLTGMNVTTTDLTVSFLKPFNGEEFLFHVDYTNVGRRMVRGTGRAYDKATGKLCATSMGSFMIIGTRDKALQV